jgi:hypothetical protein
MIAEWISEILKLDFKKDIYDNSNVESLNKIESVKKEISSKFGHWFIGDAITSIIYRKNDKLITNDKEIYAIEEDITKCWEFFNQVVPKPASSNKNSTNIDYGIVIESFEDWYDTDYVGSIKSKIDNEKVKLKSAWKAAVEKIYHIQKNY